MAAHELNVLRLVVYDRETCTRPAGISSPQEVLEHGEHHSKAEFPWVFPIEAELTGRRRLLGQRCFVGRHKEQ